MAAVSLKNMDVNELLTLRADVEKMLVEKGRDLQRQLALLGGGTAKRPGRPAGKVGRTSAMKGVKIAPKYRGPGGETWAGRGATPRWLSALLNEGHSIEEFLIGASRKRKVGSQQEADGEEEGAQACGKGAWTRAEGRECPARSGRLSDLLLAVGVAESRSPTRKSMHFERTTRARCRTTGRRRELVSFV